MSNDIAIGPISGLPGAVAISKKPSYLIFLKDSSKKSNKKFITLDKPISQGGFVEVKGIFSELSEDEIIKNFIDILTATPKELYLEVMIPWTEINYIRSLVYKQK